jgi:hypothetical protein
MAAVFGVFLYGDAPCESTPGTGSLDYGMKVKKGAIAPAAARPACAGVGGVH